MAGNDDSHRIIMIRHSNSSSGPGLSEGLRNFSVRARRTVRDLLQFVPNRHLKGRALNIQRKIERGSSAFEILFKLADEDLVRRAIHHSIFRNGASKVDES